MRSITSLVAILIAICGCSSQSNSDSPAVKPDATTHEASESTGIEGMTPMWSPENMIDNASLADDFDTNEMLDQLRAALEKHPHQAKWRAGSNFNWATFTVDFGPQFPSDPDAAFEKVWQEWTTPECELTTPEDSELLQEAIQEVLNQALKSGHSESSIIFRGFKFYVIAQQASSRRADNQFELQFLSAEAAKKAGE